VAAVQYEEPELEPEDDDDVVLPAASPAPAPVVKVAAEPGDYTTDADHVPGETAEEGERRRKRRRRRRRGRREDGPLAEASASAAIGVPLPDDAEQPDIPDLAFPVLPENAFANPEKPPLQIQAAEPAAEVVEADQAPDSVEAEPAPTEVASESARAKRGRRGGRRRRKPGEDGAETASPDTDEDTRPAPPAAPAFPAYVGPTPADPFALQGLDIFEAIEQAHLNPAPAAPAEPESGPVIKPVIIGSGEAVVVERKKGWWKR
jgi:ribonuclease E